MSAKETVRTELLLSYKRLLAKYQTDYDTVNEQFLEATNNDSPMWLNFWLQKHRLEQDIKRTWKLINKMRRK